MQPVGVAAFDLAHHLALQALKSRMGQIERHSKARHAIRRKPFLRQPQVRPEADAATLEFRIDALQPPLKARPPELQVQVTEAQLQECFIGQPRPGLPGPRGGALGRTAFGRGGHKTHFN